MKKIFIIGLVTLLYSFCSSNINLLKTEQRANELPGDWTGKQNVTVRVSKGFMKYKFVSAKDSVAVHLTININGEVHGNIGSAHIENARVIKNRNAIGRTLNLATDFAIKGKLKGKIFADDVTEEKDISIPLTINTLTITGDVFELQGIDLYPMGSFVLSK